jgi:hypothetical protein
VLREERHPSMRAMLDALRAAAPLEDAPAASATALSADVPPPPSSSPWPPPDPAGRAASPPRARLVGIVVMTAAIVAPLLWIVEVRRHHETLPTATATKPTAVVASELRTADSVGEAPLAPAPPSGTVVASRDAVKPVTGGNVPSTPKRAVGDRRARDRAGRAAAPLGDALENPFAK